MKLSDHFTYDELGNPPSEYLANAYAMASLLENIRALFGLPIRVTSGYRSIEHNRAVGGSTTSAHLTASAADFVVVGGPSVQDITRSIISARERGVLDFGELIPYDSDGHIHVTLPGVGGRGETFANVNGKLVPIAQWLGLSAVVLFGVFVFVILLLRSVINGRS